MRASALTAGLAAVMTLVLGAAFLAVDTFWLGEIDPKWGGAWDNFVLGVQLLAVSTLVEAVALGLFVASAARPAFTARRSQVTAGMVMAVATVVVWPPKARNPILMALLVGAIALLAGSASSWLTDRFGKKQGARRDAVAGA